MPGRRGSAKFTFRAHSWRYRLPSAVTLEISSEIKGLDLLVERTDGKFLIYRHGSSYFTFRYAGRRPHPASWGDIGAEEFLQVVHDVTTFVLTRFDSDDQRPLLCVRELHRFDDGASVHCFKRTRQRQTEMGQGGFPDLMSLRSVGAVGWRRCALFWARELMHARTARPWLPLPLKRDRQERQRAAVGYQSEAGIAWLAESARHWPERYCAQRWRDWVPSRRGP